MVKIKAIKFTLIILLIFSLYGCPSDPGSMDENVFEVGYEMYVPVIDNGDGTYNISNGRFRAFFSPRSGASSYELT
jgi:hypothetical protein